MKMNRFRNIFAFEFMGYLRNKVYLGLTLFLVIALGVVLSWPRISAALNSGDAEEQNPGVLPYMLVYDANAPEGGEATAAMLNEAFTDRMVIATDISIKTDEDEQAAVEKVNAEWKEYLGAVIITSPTSYIYRAKNTGMYDMTTAIIDEVMRTKYRVAEFALQGVAPEEAVKILTAEITGETVQTGIDQFNNFFYTYVLIMALYMSIMLYGQFVSMGVAAEKSSRAMELLITSADPVSLMFGKVLGIGCAGLAQFAAIFGGAAAFYQINAASWADNPIMQSIFNMPASILCYVLTFFVLGYFIYSFLYGAVGSLVSKTEDLNTASMPLTFMIIIVLFLVMMGLGTGDVDGVLMRVLSYIPFSAPMAMFIRVAMSAVPWWEIALCIGILALSCVGVGFLAAKIYRIGVLLYGKAPKPGEIVKMLRAG